MEICSSDCKFTSQLLSKLLLMIADSPPEAAHDPLIPGRTHLSTDVKALEVSRLSLQMMNMDKFKVAIIKFP